MRITDAAAEAIDALLKSAGHSLISRSLMITAIAWQSEEYPTVREAVTEQMHAWLASENDTAEADCWVERIMNIIEG